MAETASSISFRDLPSHLISELLISGRLSPIDLVNIELTSKVFGWSRHGFYSPDFKSLADRAASRLCSTHPMFVGLSLDNQESLFARCKRNWKRLLRFLIAIVESSEMVETPGGKMQVTNGDRVTMVIKNSKVYSCGSHESGALAQGPETRHCARLTPIAFPFSAQVIQVSLSESNAAFVMHSGEVYTCGENSRFGCGHSDTNLPIYKPRLVEALKMTPCKQVANGDNFTVFLSREGHVYTVGRNEYGQLGHGDTMDIQVPKIVELLKNIGAVIQVSARSFFVLAVTKDGSVYSWGDGDSRSLGHGDFRCRHEPHVIQTFKTKGVHILRVSAGNQHAAAIDSNGYVYTWGASCVGHGGRKATPKVLVSLKNHLAVQVIAGWMKTFVVVEDGSVYGFGWLGYGILGFQGGQEVDEPQVMGCLRPHRVLQVGDGLSHTVVVTQEGRLLGFGDNRGSQLGHHSIQECLQPIEIFINS